MVYIQIVQLPEDELTDLRQPLLELLSPFFSTIGLRLGTATSSSSQPDLTGSMQGEDV